MTDIAKAEQIARIQTHIEEIGKDAARRIMGRCVVDFLPVTQMQALVDQECEVMRQQMVARGGVPSDIETVMTGIRLAIIQEGRRIVEGLSTEGGRA